MDTSEKEIEKILDNINNPSYLHKNKHEITDLLSQPDSKLIIESKLKEGQRYSLLKLIDRYNLVFDESLHLNFFKYKENQNENLYSLFFQLFTKKLISVNGLNILKDCFTMENKNEIFMESEKKILMRQIESDRYFMKKEAYRNIKIDDREVEAKNFVKKCGYLHKNDLLGILGVNFESKKLVVIDLSELFDIKNCDFTDYLNDKIEKISKFLMDNRIYNDLKLKTINVDFYKKENTDKMKKIKKNNHDEKISRITEECCNIIKVFFKLYRENYSNKDLKEIDLVYSKKINDLKNYIRNLHKEKFVVYLSSNDSLEMFLAKILIFGFNMIDLKNLIVKDKNEVFINIDKIFNIENKKTAYFFGISKNPDIEIFKNCIFYEEIDVIKKIL
ncbi:hypothetical protein GVAV_001292 [Gurleya vavrai]